MRWLIGGIGAIAAVQGVSAQDGPPAAPPDAPQAISGGSDAPPRIDDVGYASIDAAAGAAPSIGHPALSVGSIVEVTAIDTGRTVLLEVTRGGGTGAFTLSPSAAAALGVETNAPAPLRVRPVNPSGQDMAALRAGSPPRRLDAPPALLTGLRKRLAPAPQPLTATEPVPAALPPPSVAPAPPKPLPRPGEAEATSGIYVQVATLSSRERADALATSVNGRVSPVGNLFRVRIGPYPDRAAADRARAGVSARGFTDARIVESR